MRIRCKTNRAADLSPEIRALLARTSTYEVWPLEVGREFLVYGVWFDKGLPGAYIDIGNDYPYPVPLPLFEITDPRLSDNFYAQYIEADGEIYFNIVFKEWANDEYFYDKLTDDMPAEKILWNQFKASLEKTNGDGGDAPH